MLSAVTKFAIAVVLLTFAAGAAAETSKPPQAPTKPKEVAKPAREDNRSVIRLSYIPGNFALPVLVGVEHGLFAREGLFISAVPVTEEGALMRSLGQGGTDFAIGSQSLLLSAAENKLDTKVVAVAGYGRAMELVVPIWDTTTKSLADLKGKTVLLISGLHNFDAVPELYRALALSKPPMRLSDIRIQFVNLADMQQLMDPRFRQAYTQRKVAGLFVFHEFASAYVSAKQARVVLTNDALVKLIGRIGAQPLFASKAAIDREPKMVERFVRGWTRTMQHLSDPASRDSVVRILQIYYLRQYGHLLKKELAEGYVDSVKYDRTVWSDKDTEEVTINFKALSAARNLLFPQIKDPNKRPFRTVANLRDFVDSHFAEKALADLARERKQTAESKTEPGAVPNGPVVNNNNSSASEKPAPKAPEKSPGAAPGTPTSPDKK